MTAVLRLESVVKNYGALRPLRIEHLSVEPGERVAIRGIDAHGAEVFVNLVTGATLPDTGAVHLFGRSTASISDSDDWLTTVDRFGIVSERAVLLDPLTVVQNLAMPFSLDIEPPPPEIRARVVELARAVGLADEVLDRPIAELTLAGRAHVRLGRALAFDPAVLLLEHPTASLTPEQARAFAGDVVRVTASRGIAVVAISSDEAFAAAVAARLLLLDAASGRLDEGHRRGWFTRQRQ